MYIDGEPGEESLVFVMRPDVWRTVDYAKELAQS
jgi:hypothetical protein